MSSKVASTPYSIGYIDAGHGHEDGLKEIALKNKAGTFQTSLEAGAAGIGAAASEAIKANVMPSNPEGDFHKVSLHNMAGATTWPIVAISYVYVRKDVSSLGNRACLLKAFLEYIISDEGQALLPDYGAVGVPPAVKAVAQSAIDKLIMPACMAWSFEGSTTMKGSGQADYVVSKKRRHYDEYSVDALMSTVKALTTRVASLEENKVLMVDGSGTTNPSKFFWQVMSLFEARAKPAVKMTYRAVGSSTGQYEFIGKDNSYMPYHQDFGSGDIPISSSDYSALLAAKKDVLHIPFQMGAMSIFHNIPGLPKSGTGALKVTACILAKIFKREIKTWDHADIMKENPDLKVPAGQNIVVYHRKLGSSTTSGVTTYLRAACPTDWPQSMVGKLITWPSDTKVAEGSGGMSAGISATEYAIGYIDSGHGHEDGLKEIELKNKDGTYQSSLEAGSAGIGAAASEAIKAKIMPLTATGDFGKVSLHNQAGTTTWPIVAISYIYLRKDLTAMGEKACLLKAFIEFILSAEGQKLLPAFGAVGVPQSVKDLGTNGLALLKMPTCKAWNMETSTMKGGGQADHIISAKRRSFYEYDDDTSGKAVEKLNSAVGISGNTFTESIAAQVAAMKQEIATLKTQVKSSGSGGGGDKDDDDSDVLGLVGVIIGAVALLCAVGALGKAFTAGKGGAGGGGPAATQFGNSA